MTLPPLPPPTVQGLEGAAWARRTEAHAAMLFARELSEYEASARSVDPDARIVAQAVLTAREEATQAIALWRTAVTEMRRAALGEAKPGPRLVPPPGRTA